jgi:DNA-binding response OmpR family regulator
VFDEFPERVRWGALDVVPQALVVRRNARPLSLTLRQFSTLMAFLAQPHRTLTREEIWDFCRRHEGRPHLGQAPDLRVVDTYVRQLRRKLGTDAVITVRGVGYRLGPCMGAAPTPPPLTTLGQIDTDRHHPGA